MGAALKARVVPQGTSWLVTNTPSGATRHLPRFAGEESPHLARFAHPSYADRSAQTLKARTGR